MIAGRLDPLGLALAVLTAVVLSLGAYYGLTRLAAPNDVAPRLAALKQSLDMTEQQFRASANKALAVPTAPCPGASDGQIAVLKQAVMDQAGAAGLTLDAITLAPDETSDPDYLPVSLRIQASGPYDVISRFIDGLSRAKPDLFVNSVDIVSKNSNLHLVFAGRYYCKAPG